MNDNQTLEKRIAELEADYLTERDWEGLKDSLKAREERIAQLEAQNSYTERRLAEWQEAAAQLRERITELETSLLTK
jgi:hypothetical protein